MTARILSAIAVLLFIAGLLVLCAVRLAHAHDFYPIECCSGTDCRVAADGEVVTDPRGWRVVPTGEIYPQSKVRMSPDGRFHRCLSNPKDPTSTTLCLFVPDVGS